MTNDDKALVERLRDDWPEILVEKHWMMDSDAIDAQRAEAATRIEALSAENERLLDIDEVKAKAIDNMLNQLANAEQENERLREALHMIKTGRCVTDWIDQPHEQMQDCAREALGEQQ